MVRLVTHRAFIDEGLIFLDDFEQSALSLLHRPDDAELLLWLAKAMKSFSKEAALHGLTDVSLFSEEVARVFAVRIETQRPLTISTIRLVQAALSQLRLMLLPTIDGAGENALRIMTGLLNRL